MATRRMVTTVALLCVVAAAAFGDTIVLNNGAELRNVKIVEEGEHTIKINVIGYTNIVVGKSKITSVQKDGGRVAVSAPAAGEPEPARTAQPDLAARVADREVASRAAYKFPSSEEGKHIEIVVAVLKDGTTEVEVIPPQGESGEKEHVYALTAEGGEKIGVAVQRDDFGEVMAMEIKPPEPPRTSPKEAFEYSLKSVEGKTLKIKAKWDWNTRTIQDMEFLP